MYGKARFVKLSGLIPKTIDVVAMAEELNIPLNTFRAYLYGFRRPAPETAEAIRCYLADKGFVVTLNDILIKNAS